MANGQPLSGAPKTLGDTLMPGFGVSYKAWLIGQVAGQMYVLSKHPANASNLVVDFVDALLQKLSEDGLVLGGVPV